MKRCAGPKFVLNQFGYFFTPKNSIHEQDYHLDFSNDVESIFIPLVPVTTQNSTRYMTNFPSSNPIKSVKNGYDIRFGASDLELLEHEGKDFI